MTTTPEEGSLEGEGKTSYEGVIPSNVGDAQTSIQAGIGKVLHNSDPDLKTFIKYFQTYYVRY
jgi:hypothetical protein